MAGEYAYKLIGGLILGTITGFVSSYWVRKIRTDVVLAILIAFLCF